MSWGLWMRELVEEQAVWDYDDEGGGFRMPHRWIPPLRMGNVCTQSFRCTPIGDVRGPMAAAGNDGRAWGNGSEHASAGSRRAFVVGECSMTHRASCSSTHSNYRNAC